MIDSFLDWLGYQIVCNSPRWVMWRAINADHWLGRWALPRAGGWAHRDAPTTKTDQGAGR